MNPFVVLMKCSMKSVVGQLVTCCIMIQLKSNISPTEISMFVVRQLFEHTSYCYGKQFIGSVGNNPVCFQVPICASLVKCQ